MAAIKREGAPTSNTKGCIGQLYIDTLTGNMYVCVSAYSDTSGNKGYDWRLNESKLVVKEEEPTFQEEIEEPTPVEEIEEEVEEEPVKPAPQQERRNNYGKPYNKHPYNKPNRN